MYESNVPLKVGLGDGTLVYSLVRNTEVAENEPVILDLQMSKLATAPRPLLDYY